MKAESNSQPYHLLDHLGGIEGDGVGEGVGEMEAWESERERWKAETTYTHARRVTVAARQASPVTPLPHGKVEGEAGEHDDQHERVHHDVEQRAVLQSLQQTCAQKNKLAQFH